jgi:hypothetical protein
MTGKKTIPVQTLKLQSSHESGKVVIPTPRPPLPQGNIPGAHFLKRLSQAQELRAAGSIISITGTDIEPAIFRLVA